MSLFFLHALCKKPFCFSFPSENSLIKDRKSRCRNQNNLPAARRVFFTIPHARKVGAEKSRPETTDTAGKSRPVTTDTAGKSRLVTTDTAGKSRPVTTDTSGKSRLVTTDTAGKSRLVTTDTAGKSRPSGPWREIFYIPSRWKSYGLFVQAFAFESLEIFPCNRSSIPPPPYPAGQN
jgi:hypothetical protein